MDKQMKFWAIFHSRKDREYAQRGRENGRTDHKSGFSTKILGGIPRGLEITLAGHVCARGVSLLPQTPYHDFCPGCVALQ